MIKLDFSRISLEYYLKYPENTSEPLRVYRMQIKETPNSFVFGTAIADNMLAPKAVIKNHVEKRVAQGIYRIYEVNSVNIPNAILVIIDQGIGVYQILCNQNYYLFYFYERLMHEYSLFIGNDSGNMEIEYGLTDDIMFAGAFLAAVRHLNQPT